MLIRVLGPVRVVDDDGAEVSLPAGKPRALLCALALTPRRPLSVPRIVEALWGETPPASAGNAVQVYVGQLRKALGASAIRTVPNGYALDVRSDEIDAVRFEELRSAAASAAADGDDDRAISLLEEALSLWHGDLVVPHEDASWLQGEHARLLQAREAAVTERLEARIRTGDAEAVLGELTALVADHPYTERYHELLIRALASAGRRDAALAAYRAARHALGEGLGLDPGPGLQAAQAAVLAGDRDRPTPRSVRAAVSRLPIPLDPLVGRHREVADLVSLVSGTARLVTVTGPGGVGKTRVALAVATELADKFPDGVAWVPLASLSEHASVGTAVCSALGLHDAASDAEALLVDHLRRRRLMLLCDNFEHLTGAAPLLGRLLAASPDLRVLVTSRSTLRITGEHRYDLQPLPVPGERLGTMELPSVELFWQRARAVRSELPADPAREATAVRQICTALDGLPLALELAAARLTLFSLAELARRLEQRLPTLTGGAADVPARHRSLRETIEWSAALLSAPAQRLLGRLSAFRGGATLLAVERVADHDGALAGRAIEGLAELADGSLIRVAHGPGGAASRVTMLAVVREYAQEPLAADDRAKTAEAHARYIAEALTTPWSSVPMYPRTADELRSGLDEADNVRAAVAWAAEERSGALLADLLAGAAPLWHVAGWAREWLGWVGRTDDARLPPSRRSDIRIWQAVSAWNAGSVDAALAAATDAIAAALAAADERRLAVAHSVMAELGGFLGRPDRFAHVAETLALLDGCGLEADVRAISRSAAATAYGSSALRRAEALQRQALEEALVGGNDIVAMIVANNLAEMLLLAGDNEQALAVLQDAVPAELAELAPLQASYPIAQRGVAKLLIGDVDAAAQELTQALELTTRAADTVNAVDLLRCAAGVVAARGDWEVAAQLLAGHDAQTAAADLPSDSSSRLVVCDLPRQLRSHLSAEQRVVAEERSRGARRDELLAVALDALRPPSER